MGIDIKGHSHVTRTPIPVEYRSTRIQQKPLNMRAMLNDTLRSGVSAQTALDITTLRLTLAGLNPDTANYNSVNLDLPPLLKTSNESYEWAESLGESTLQVLWDEDLVLSRNANTECVAVMRTYSGHAEWMQSVGAAAKAAGLPFDLSFGYDGYILDTSMLGVWRDQLDAVWPVWYSAHAAGSRCDTCSGKAMPMLCALPLTACNYGSPDSVCPPPPGADRVCYDLRVYATIRQVCHLGATDGVAGVS